MEKKIVFCNCGANLIGKDRLEQIAQYLNKSGHSVVEISDLCGYSVNHKADVRNLFDSDEEILIIACYRRVITLLLRNCGISSQNLKLSYLNFRELNNDQLMAGIDLFLAGETSSGTYLKMAPPSEWPSWYPIIDYSRCTSCGQCADFCLFGVYEKIDNKVVVVNPKGCKNNCPACARICPATALIFPKYDHPGAIAGSETIDELAEQQRLSQDIDTILGSNIYKALEMRKAKRQSIIRSAAMQQAIADRDKALAEKSNHH